ncbi:hyaluronoglucosaminidase [Streptomyces sp. CA-210063]|uniref:hyaluronoglucosaminidase n=1 Tax=Streptomyces sp. CA-210063 TaxID=2801029 RepID=UPI00214AE9F8|nr:hyaluronoglucosaminidase [Streptomyces sp. CA-210063]UUU30243.1 hyaluronoglucosaminidase [Streptomyces sp. CA-210063]
MAVGRRVFLGGFTAGAVTVAVAGAETAAAAGEYTQYTAPAQFYGTSTTEHTVTINHKATSGEKTVALNVTSDNPETSAMYLKGVETAHGTLKISHVGYADGSDPGSSALSIDLLTAGTAAQGIFVTASDAPTKGALLVLRNNPGLDDFVVKGNGTTGIGMGRGNNPQSQLHVIQRTGAASAILAEGAVRLANVATEPTGAPAAAGGGSLYAQGGKLFWKAVGGTPTQLA